MSVRLVSPASSRQALGTEEALAQYIVSRTIVYHPGSAPAFWELARFSKSELAGIASPDNVAKTIQTARQRVFSDLDTRENAEGLQKKVAREIMVTNLGHFPYPPGLGELQLAGV